MTSKTALADEENNTNDESHCSLPMVRQLIICEVLVKHRENLILLTIVDGYIAL